MSVTASEARRRLFPLIEEVNDDQVAVEIVSKKGTAFLVSARKLAPGVIAPPRRRKPSKGAEAYALRRAAQAALAAERAETDDDPGV